MKPNDDDILDDNPGWFALELPVAIVLIAAIVTHAIALLTTGGY